MKIGDSHLSLRTKTVPVRNSSINMMSEENTTETKPAVTNVTMLRNGTYTHLLRICLVAPDLYVHFVSRDSAKHPAWDGKQITEMHVPDHISYHRDGKVHLKHKKGRYSGLPFQLPEDFLGIDKLLNLPLLAVSFYEKGFTNFSEGIGKPLTERPEDHDVIETCNITITVVVIIRDLAPTPNEERCIYIMFMPGGFVPKPEDKVVLQGKEGVQLMLVNFNPTWNQLRSELKLFSKDEESRCKQFMERASTQFGGQMQI